MIYAREVAIIILYLFFCTVAAIIASHKGRSERGFFFLSLIASPLVGIVSAALIRPDVKKIEKYQIANNGMKKCNFCAELVKSEAIICKHCHNDLTADAANHSHYKSYGGEEYVTVGFFAKERNIEPRKVIKMIQDEFYQGQIINGEWYVHEAELLETVS